MNTIKKSQIRFLIFKEKGDKLYTGVCLDFGIVVQGEDEGYVKYQLEKGAVGYIKTVKKEKMDEALLNNQAEKKYFDRYNKLLKEELKRDKTKKDIASRPSQPDIELSLVSISNLLNNSCYA